MSNYSAIQQLLNSQLSSMASIMGGTPWKRENLDIAPNENEIYIESELIPAETGYPNVGLIGFEHEFGTFAVYVKGVRYQGWGGYSDIVDEIIDHFPRNLILADSASSINLKILKAFALSGFTASDGRYTIPVYVRYDTYICY